MNNINHSEVGKKTTYRCWLNGIRSSRLIILYIVTNFFLFEICYGRFLSSGVLILPPRKYQLRPRQSTFLPKHFSQEIMFLMTSPNPRVTRWYQQSWGIFYQFFVVKNLVANMESNWIWNGGRRIAVHQSTLPYMKWRYVTICLQCGYCERIEEGLPILNWKESLVTNVNITLSNTVDCMHHPMPCPDPGDLTHNSSHTPDSEITHSVHHDYPPRQQAHTNTDRHNAKQNSQE